MKAPVYLSLLFAFAVSMGFGHHSLADHHESKPTPFSLPDLPYAADALEPVIDKRTMEIHHGRHHQAYVNNLNNKVADFPALASLELKDILDDISSYDTAVRNNAGGHYNHKLFWKLMAPVQSTGEPSSELAARIERDFGSFDAFREEFNDKASKIFGSGWAWLIAKADGSLQVTTTPNQDNPLMDVVSERGTPLLALDVWEHAYYLQYQSQRADYIAKWWDVVNWNEVNDRFNTLNAQ